MLESGGYSSQSGAGQSHDIARQLQKSYGNKYVQRLVDHIHRKRVEEVQTRLTVGPAGDKYEQEADRVAKQVMNMTEPGAQRQEEEEELQMTPIQRDVSADGGEVDAEFEKTVERIQGDGRPLPDNLRSTMESSFGAEFGDVRIHTGAESDALNRSINARAFTAGQDIFVRREDYNPGSSAGKELLAHELTHVVQQNGADVQRQEPEEEELQMKPLQRQDGETTSAEEEEGTLPDGEVQGFQHGPCDCMSCNAHPDTISLHKVSKEDDVALDRSPLTQPMQRIGKVYQAPVTHYTVNVGTINYEFTNPGNKVVEAFGTEDFNCSHKGAKWKANGKNAKLDFTIKIHCPWGVDGGGNIDVKSGTDPEVTTDEYDDGSIVWEQIVQDFTPDNADSWRPPREYFWSESLTRRHERFHSLADFEWAKNDGTDIVKNHLEGKSVTAVNTTGKLTTLLNEAMTLMGSANWDWYSGNGKPYIERPGEMAAFLDGKDPYFALAAAVKTQGEKLVAEEAGD